MCLFTLDVINCLQMTDRACRLTPSKPLPPSDPVKLGAGDTLKVILTTQDGKSAKRPHQAFLLLQDPSTNLDISYPFSVKESGKAKVELVGSCDVTLPPEDPSLTLTSMCRPRRTCQFNYYGAYHHSRQA